MKKVCIAFLCFCMCLTVMVGCGKPQRNAADSIKAIYDLYILRDTDGISSLGMTEEEIADAQAAYDDSLKETIRTNFSESGQSIEEDVLNDLCDARKKALSKMTATAEITSESDGRATVLLHTTYIDEATLDEDSFYNAREIAQQTSFDDLSQQQIFLMDTYTQNLIASYEGVTPSKDTVAITVDCVIQDNNWVPANMSSFGSDLAIAISGSMQD
ncbi:MAG: hypothetical protein RSF88_00940 [Lachnospiraceae bacterium]